MSHATTSKAANYAPTAGHNRLDFDTQVSKPLLAEHGLEIGQEAKFEKMSAADENLQPFAENMAVHLLQCERALAFLKKNGVTDQTVLRNYRVGAGYPALFDNLAPDTRAHLKQWKLIPPRGQAYLATKGLAIPLYHPERLSSPTSFVHISEVQNKFRMAGPVAGIACPPDVNDHDRIVIVDSPLVMLRIAQFGVKGVVLAPDPAVLVDLVDWLRSRHLVVASIRTDKAAALQNVLRDLRLDHEVAVLPPDLHSAKATSLACLGVQKTATDKLVPSTPITPFMLRDLHQFAQMQLDTKEGRAALAYLGVDTPEVVATLEAGYLPADFREAVPSVLQQAFLGHSLGNSIFIPALAESGSIVDGLYLPANQGRKVFMSLFPEPQGLIGGKVATSFKGVLITDTAHTWLRLLQAGHRNALLLRGTADAHQNGARLRRSGVESARIFCRHDPEIFASALKAAGIVCKVIPFYAQRLPKPILEKPVVGDGAETGPKGAPVGNSSGSVLEFIRHDQRLEQASYRSSDATFTIETALEAGKRLEVSLERGGAVHRDRFDLSVEAQRRRFASSAAVQTGMPVEIIDANLIALLDKVRELQAARYTLAGTKPHHEVAISPEDRKQAEARLRQQDLFDQILADLESLGWVGEENIKGCLYLTSLSRKLDRPIWSALRATEGAGKSHGQDLIVALTPPEELMQLSRLSDSALYYQNPSALSHKLVVFDEADALSDEVFIALRVLKTRGALSHSYVQRNHFTGETRSHVIEVRGPVAVITTTAGKLDSQFLSRCMDLAVDESPEQTLRVIEAQKRLRTRVASPGGNGAQAALVHRHHTLQRLLQPSTVVIPFADRIDFPASDIRFRRLLEHFLGLIEASALLHQFQRIRHEGAVVADLRDFNLAVRLFEPLLRSTTQGLSLRSRELLQALSAEGKTTFRRADVDRLKPDWTRFYYRHALRELLALEYIVKTQARKGQEAEYRVLSFPAPGDTARTIRLRDEAEGLAVVGGLQKANLNPNNATG